MKCFYCETLNGPFETDHVVPSSRGGPDIQDNRVSCCYECNRSKNDLLPSEWTPRFRVPDAAIKIEKTIALSWPISDRAKRGRAAAGVTEDPGWSHATDPFERKLEIVRSAGAPRTVIDAAIFTHDTLEFAESIVRARFKTRNVDHVIAVAAMIDSRERYLRSRDEEPRIAEDDS